MLTPKVTDFIVKYIESIEQLEVLLLLHENKGREWTASNVNEIIRSSDCSITKHLEKWLSLGLLRIKERSGGLYSYAPASPELDSTVEELANYYRERRTTVVEYIYSRPLREIHHFSDAFKFRKDS